jgi:hypothetical protein
MAAVPISQTGKPAQMRSSQYNAPHSETGSGAISALPKLVSGNGKHASSPRNWKHYVAGSAVLTGGILLVCGQRRAGLALASAGTALALIEEQELVQKWWKDLPTHLRNAQQFLDKAEDYMKEAAEQGHRLQSILRR